MSSNSYQSKDMANVKKIFADKQMDKRTNGWAKNYMPPIYPCGGIIKTQIIPTKPCLTCSTGKHLNKHCKNVCQSSGDINS